MTYNINVLVDWGKAFVDTNGSFYCGTTEQQKDNAALIARKSDLLLYLGDVHTRSSSEFNVNGGLYPAHNLVKKDWHDLDQLGIAPSKTASPELTDKIKAVANERYGGLIVPRHVFFQDYNGGEVCQPDFTFEDVEQTFGLKRLDCKEFLDGKVNYVLNAKHMNNGAALQATQWLGSVEGVPEVEMSIFSLLKQKYGLGKDLKFDITGVVMGICVYQTATGIRQLFPYAEINVIADACTHLVYPPLGISSEKQGNEVSLAMFKQMGINYISTQEYLGGK